MAGTRTAVLAAFLGNVAIALAKFAGAYVSGSSALLAEAMHSVVDCGNEIFLFLGLKLQDRPFSEHYPFGYGRERFFWSLIAAIFIFAGGALASVYEGATKWQHPQPLSHAGWALGILAFSLVAESSSLSVSLREAEEQAGHYRLHLLSFLRVTSDATLLTVVLEDGAAILGLVIAAVGILLTLWTGDGHYDAGASMAIGGLLAYMAFVLGGRSHALLLGQAATSATLTRIQGILEASPVVERVLDSYTVRIAPGKLVLSAHLAVPGRLSTTDVGAELKRVEHQLRTAIPGLEHIFLEVRPAEPGEKAA